MMRLLWIFPIVFLFESALRPVGEPDIFFYFALVERYISTGQWPTIDPFVYTPIQVEGYYTLHQWLGYWLLYLPYWLGGWTGLILFKSLLLGFALALPLWVSRAKGWRWSDPMLWTLAIFAGHHRFRERASLFGDLFLEILLLGLLFWNKQKWFFRSLPVLFLFWAQIHPSFPLGWLIIGLFALVNWREAIRDGWMKWMALTLVTPFLNPNGWRGVLYPFQFNLEVQPYLKKYIMEWLPLYDERVYPFVFLYIPLVLGLALAVYMLARRTWRSSLFVYAVLGVAMVFMVQSVRFGFTGVLMLLCLWVYVAPEERRVVWPGLMRVALALTVMLAILAARFVNSPYLRLPLSERFGLDFRMPVAAAKFLKEKPLQGAIFNSFGYGGYLAWAWQGSPPIFFHGFSTNFRFYERTYSHAQESPENLNKLIQDFGIRHFLLSKSMNDSEFIQFLQQRSDFALIYQDDEAVIFSKKN